MGSMGAKNCLARSVGLSKVYPSSFCGGLFGAVACLVVCAFPVCALVAEPCCQDVGSVGVGGVCVAKSKGASAGVEFCPFVALFCPNKFCAKFITVGFVIICKIAPVLSSLLAVGDDSFVTPSKMPRVSSFKKGAISCNFGDDCVFLDSSCQAKNSIIAVDQFKIPSFLYTNAWPVALQSFCAHPSVAICKNRFADCSNGRLIPLLSKTCSQRHCTLPLQPRNKLYFCRATLRMTW